jgi:hypothetical protein
VQEATEQALKQLDDVLNALEEEARMYQDNLSRMKSETEYNELVIECGGEADVMQVRHVTSADVTSHRCQHFCLSRLSQCH